MKNLRMIFNNYLMYCIKQKNLDAKTVKAYRNDLEQFFEFINSSNSQISKDTIISYLEHLHDRFKPKTVKRKIASIKAFMSYCENEEYLCDNPFRKLKIKYKAPLILPKTISFEDLQKIIASTYRQFETATTTFEKNMALRDIAVLELLFASGVRVSELCDLKLSDVNLKENHIRIMGKGAKERIIQITNLEVIQALHNYMETFHNYIKSELTFFINRCNEKLSEQTVRQIINKHVTLTGLGIHITPHMFRHTFATLLLEEDVDIRYIQGLLGHSSIVTTQIYTHISANKQRNILSVKHPRNKLLIR